MLGNEVPHAAVEHLLLPETGVGIGHTLPRQGALSFTTPELCMGRRIRKADAKEDTASYPLMLLQKREFWQV